MSQNRLNGKYFEPPVVPVMGGSQVRVQTPPLLCPHVCRNIVPTTRSHNRNSSHSNVTFSFREGSGVDFLD